MSAAQSVNAAASESPPSAALRHPMQAIVHRQYGPPAALSCEPRERPLPGDDEVLVRVCAAGVSIGDHHIVTGKPYLVRLSPFGGLPRPKHAVPGGALAGRVEAVGAKVTAFAPGDEVFGQAENGAFAEYLVMPAALLARKPSNLSFVEAAAVPWGTTALQGLRDAGQVQAGQRVLVNGAAGAVGSWAVQIGKALGAHVTAVCSARSVDLVRSLGADEVIDYTQQDFVTGGARFDVMFDGVGNRSLADCRRVLLPTGTYVPCAAGDGDWVGPFARILAGLVTFLFSQRTFKLFIQKLNATDLVFMKNLIEAGKAKPVIDRTYPLSQASEALHHVGQGHARGLTVLHIAD